MADNLIEVAPGFDVARAGGEQLRARRILIAMGSRDVLPDLPGVHDGTRNSWTARMSLR